MLIHFNWLDLKHDNYASQGSEMVKLIKSWMRLMIWHFDYFTRKPNVK